jgi:hypothetical protein
MIFKSLSPILRVVVVLSLLVLIISFTQPAFFIDRPEDPGAYSNGLILFLLGWMSPLGGALDAFIIWLANPLYIIAVILAFRKKPSALYFSLAAFVLALSFALITQITTSESGAASVITERGAGYFLWLTALAILSAGLGIEKMITTGTRTASR